MTAVADGAETPPTVPTLFPGHRRLRHVTYALVSLAALGLSLSGTDEMMREYELGVPLGLLAGFGQGVALVLALRRPFPAWTLSLTTAAVTALAARSALDPRPALHHGPYPGPDWPWTTTEVTVQAVVLLLLALRVPARRALAALAATGLTTFVIQGCSAPRATPRRARSRWPSAPWPSSSAPPCAVAARPVPSSSSR